MYDYRGPLKIEKRKALESNAGGPIGVDQVVLGKDGTLGVPTSRYMKKWVPRETEYHEDGSVVLGTRPWVAHHSVKKHITYIKIKTLQRIGYV